jgi:hypothetical protein
MAAVVIDFRTHNQYQPKCRPQLGQDGAKFELKFKFSLLHVISLLGD